MAEKLCTLRTKGGGGGAKQTETVLWTNSSPSSSSGFAAQTVTLSDDINNYDYIKIIGAVDYSHLTGNCEGGMIISSADTAKIVTAPCFSLSLSAISGSSNYTRPISFPSSSSVGFGNCLPLRSSTTANTYCIPTAIIGIKNNQKAGNDIDLLWTNPNPTSAFTAQTVSIDLSKYSGVLIDGVYGSTDLPHGGTSKSDCFYVQKGQNYTPHFGYVISGGYMYVTCRSVSVSDSGVVFGGGGYYKNTSYVSENAYALPIRIYGVKNALPS